MDGASGGVIDEENNEWGEEELEEQPAPGIPNALLLNGSGGSPGHDDLEKNLDDASNLLETENQAFQQRMWASFQNCARAIAQVYVCKEQRDGGVVASRDRGGDEQQQQRPHECDSHSPNDKPPVVFEESFRSAAQHATTLYKDSLETSRRLIDLAIKTGSNRRTKEILAFVKGRKKRFIRRDELLNILVGERSGGSSSSAAKGGGRKHHHLDNSYSFAGIISSSATQACSPVFIAQQQGSVAQSSSQGSSQIFGMNPFSAHLLGGSCSRPHHEEDPTNLHLGLQQLFVAGNSSHGHGHPVKRPANSISSANNNPLHLSADEDDDRVLLRNNNSVANTRVDDELMEDSVESADNNTNFKRMRFY